MCNSAEQTNSHENNIALPEVINIMKYVKQFIFYLYNQTACNGYYFFMYIYGAQLVVSYCGT